MNIKTIESELGLITWNPFNRSYILLKDTTPELIECEIELDLLAYKPIYRLIFCMYETTGLQESTRSIKRDVEKINNAPVLIQCFTLEEKEVLCDQILVDYFIKFNESNYERIEKRNKLTNTYNETLGVMKSYLRK